MKFGLSLNFGTPEFLSLHIDRIHSLEKMEPTHRAAILSFFLESNQKHEVHPRVDAVNQILGP